MGQQTPCSSQAWEGRTTHWEGSLQLFTQYSPITLAPIAPTFLLEDCKVGARRKQSRSMPLPNITREDSEAGSIQTGSGKPSVGKCNKEFSSELLSSVVLTSADIERQDEGQSTSLIFPSEMLRIENVQNSAKGKIQRQRSKSH